MVDLIEVLTHTELLITSCSVQMFLSLFLNLDPRRHQENYWVSRWTLESLELGLLLVLGELPVDQGKDFYFYLVKKMDQVCL